MIEVSAEENRLLARAAGASERVALKYFPGSRWVAGRQAYSLPRQMGTYVLLDRLFGPDGWRAPGALMEEVGEARRLVPADPADDAFLDDDGQSFFVRCVFADRELVKRVPGYQWLPQEKRWRLPRVPETLRILEEGFGQRLVLPEAEDVQRWREDEERRIEGERQRAEQQESAQRAAGQTLTAPEGSEGTTAAAVRLAEEVRAAERAGAGTVGEEAAPQGLLERLDRLAAALERLVAALEQGAAPAPAMTGPQQGGDVQEAEREDAGERSGASIDWRKELDGLRSAHGPAELQVFEGRLQAADSEGQAAALRFLIGMWHFTNQQYPEALRSLRRMIGQAGQVDRDLEVEAERGLKNAAARWFSASMGAPNESLEAPFALLAAELRQRGAGLQADPQAWREAADDLAADNELARRDPALHGLARLAQFASARRAGSRVDEQRVAEFVKEYSASGEVRALGLILLATLLYDAEDVAEWEMKWPKPTATAGDFSWVAEAALAAAGELGDRRADLVPLVALAALAIIADGKREWATRHQRIQLVRCIPADHQLRRYAEFLAAYQLAAAGDGKGIERDFKGYFEYLQGVRLDDSREHLETVLATDSGHVTNHIIDTVLPAALEARGIGDVQVLMDVAEFATSTQKGDNTLNRIADAVEEGTILGAEALSGEQRLHLFRLALETAKKKAHDQDADQAFLRMVRELLRQGRDDEVPNLCEEYCEAFPALRERAALAALEWALERGEPYEELAERVVRAFRRDSSRKDPPRLLPDLRVLAAAFPQLWSEGSPTAALLGPKPTGGTEPRETPNFAGMSVLVVGGHPRLQERAVPELESMGLKVDWLDADEAKQGDRATSRAKGEVDLVVVNTAYIGHAASGRVVTAAQAAGKKYIQRAFTGVRMLAATVAVALMDDAKSRGGTGRQGSRPR